MGKTCKIASCNCDNCTSRFMSSNSICSEANVLSKLHQESPWEISVEVKDFLLMLEYIFRELSSISAVRDCNTFKTKFSDIVLSQVEIPFEHCSKTIENLILFFVTFRSKLEIHCRLLHSKNKFASKN
ncbi:hypothetical protein ACKWTF_009501 [Chironomus riparius]